MGSELRGRFVDVCAISKRGVSFESCAYFLLRGLRDVRLRRVLLRGCEGCGLWRRKERLRRVGKGLGCSTERNLLVVAAVVVRRSHTLKRRREKRERKKRKIRRAKKQKRNCILGSCS